MTYDPCFKYLQLYCVPPTVRRVVVAAVVPPLPPTQFQSQSPCTAEAAAAAAAATSSPSSSRQRGRSLQPHVRITVNCFKGIQLMDIMGYRLITNTSRFHVFVYLYVYDVV